MIKWCANCGDTEYNEWNECLLCIEETRREHEDLTRKAERIIEIIGAEEVTLYLRHFFDDPDAKEISAMNYIYLEQKKKLIERYKHLLEE